MASYNTPSSSRINIKRYRSIYKYYLLYMPIITAYIIMLATVPKMFTIAFICLIGYSLTGKEQAIKSLSLLIISKCLNPALFAFPAEAGLIAWLCYFSVCTRLILTSLTNAEKKLSVLMLFSLVVLVLTITASKEPLISFIKLFIFTYGSAAIILAYTSLKTENYASIQAWFFSLIYIIVLLSISVSGFHHIVYNLNDAGFQGITSHPQTFGPMLAPFAAWHISNILFYRKKQLLFNVVATSILIILMILSQARTSIVSVFLALSTAYIFYSFKLSGYRTFRPYLIAIIIAIISILAVYFSESLYIQLEQFIFKRSSINIDEAMISRSGGIKYQWNNFLERPWFGHGFGIYPTGSLPDGVIYFNGIPISAPVEKGFLPTALLEEIGSIGSLFFILFIYKLIKYFNKINNINWLSMFLACIFINTGEMLFFSLGGVGLFYWLLIGLCIMSSHNAIHTNKQKQKQKQVNMHLL